MSTLFQHFLLLLSTCRAQTYLDTSSTSGKSTYYGGNPSAGACGYTTVATASFPFGYYAACGDTAFNSGYGCGACYEITCIGQYESNPDCHCSTSTPSVVISCMDQCPECAATHFDLDPTAMARIVGDGLSGTCGVIETSIRRVSCDYNGNIKIRSKSGTSAYWFGLHLDDVAGYGAVSAVKLKSSGSSSWSTTCTKDNGPSFWICSGGFPLIVPLSVQLTNDNGDTVTCDGCIGSTAADTEWDFGSNFGGSSGSTPSGSVRTPSPVPASDGGSSSGSSGSITITNKEGLNMWWYAVTLSVPSGVTVTSLKMKDSSMSSWEEGVSEWNYYKFTGNKPYSAPFHFKVTVSGQDYVGWNVINSITAGDSGSVTLSAAFIAEGDEGSTEGMSSGETAIVVLSIVLLCCMAGALCFVCYRRRNKAIAAGVEDDDIVVEEMGKNADWDMTPIGSDTKKGVEREQETMIDVEVTETIH